MQVQAHVTSVNLRAVKTGGGAEFDLLVNFYSDGGGLEETGLIDQSEGRVQIAKTDSDQQIRSKMAQAVRDEATRLGHTIGANELYLTPIIKV